MNKTLRWIGYFFIAIVTLEMFFVQFYWGLLCYLLFIIYDILLMEHIHEKEEKEK